MITVKQVHAFMDAVNAGRTEYGVKPLSELEFYGCKPGNAYACLSARNLIVPIGGMSVLEADFTGVPEPERLAATLDTQVRVGEIGVGDHVVIPKSIRDVTDEFDQLPRSSGVVDPRASEVKEFRQVLVEAGVVKD